MTIAQRYGLFTVVPGIVLLFIIGVALTSSDADEDEVSDAIVAPAAAEMEPEPGKQPVPVQAPDSKPETNPLPTRANHDSVAQLAAIAQQANQQAPANQPDSDKAAAKPALNDLASAPETDPEISNLPPVTHEVITDAMKSIRPAARKCYDTLREESPDTAGTVLLQIVFENEDDNLRAQLSEVDPRSTLHDEGLHNCLIEAVATIELPQSPTKLTIYYPFVFKPDDSQ